MTTNREKMEYTVVVLKELLSISKDVDIELEHMLMLAISIYDDHLENGPRLKLEMVVDNEVPSD